MSNVKAGNNGKLITEGMTLEIQDVYSYVTMSLTSNRKTECQISLMMRW